MRKSLVAITIVALVAAGAAGYFAYSQWQQRQFIASVAPHVKNTSLRVNNALQLDSKATSRMTYKEVFEKLEGDIAEIDKRVLEIQTVSNSGNKEISEPLISYIKSSQELLRAQLTMYRKRLAASTAIKWLEDSNNELRQARGYGIDYALKRSQKAADDAQKTQAEIEGATNDVIASARQLKEQRGLAAMHVSVDALVDDKQLETVASLPLGTVSTRADSSNDVDTTNNAIQTAILRGDAKEAIELISMKQVNIDSQNSDGNTALHIAATKGQEDVAAALMRAGADMKLKNKKGELAAALARTPSVKEIVRPK